MRIIKLAGMNLKENSSGKHKGKTRLSKRGRKRHRHSLFKVLNLQGVVGASACLSWFLKINP